MISFRSHSRSKAACASVTAGRPQRALREERESPPGDRHPAGCKRPSVLSGRCCEGEGSPLATCPGEAGTVASDLGAGSHPLPPTAAPAHRITRQREQTSDSTTSYCPSPNTVPMATKQRPPQPCREWQQWGRHLAEQLLCTKHCHGLEPDEGRTEPAEKRSLCTQVPDRDAQAMLSSPPQTRKEHMPPGGLGYSASDQ